MRAQAERVSSRVMSFLPPERCRRRRVAVIPAGRSSQRCRERIGRLTASNYFWLRRSVRHAMAGELPDFHIPHAEKIEWMIETDGSPLEAVAAATPRVTRREPGYTYTIGFPEHVGFPEVAVFGLTPVAARRACSGSSPTPASAGPRSRSASRWSACSTTNCGAASRPSTSASGARSSPPPQAWYRAEHFEMVQLIYPGPQRVLAVRGRLRPAHAVRPAGTRPGRLGLRRVSLAGWSEGRSCRPVR